MFFGLTARFVMIAPFACKEKAGPAEGPPAVQVAGCCSSIPHRAGSGDPLRQDERAERCDGRVSSLGDLSAGESPQMMARLATRLPPRCDT